MISRVTASIVLVAAIAISPWASAQHVWPEELLKAAATIPIQDGGRIKPLDTFARFELLQLNGKRSFTDVQGNRHGSLEWLLDCLFFPDTAKEYKVFLVESVEVMDAIGLRNDKPRDRFSYNELLPNKEHLFHLAQEYSQFEQKQRTPAQNQLINLAHNFHDFEMLAGFLGFARQKVPVQGEAMVKLFDGNVETTLSAIVGKAPQIIALMQSGDGGDLMNTVQTMLQQAERTAGSQSSLALLPPSDDAANHTEWLTPVDVLGMSFQPPYPLESQVALLAQLEQMEQAKGDMAQLTKAVMAYHDTSVSIASARGEYNKIPLEVSYYKGDYFYWSLLGYILAFLLACVVWLRPRNKTLAWAAGIALTVPFLFHVTGIAIRCIIRNRPPVTTLYETILFISAVAVFVALCVEIMNRRRVGLSLGAFMGVVGIFLAGKYETIERVDTMPSLIAVLDTNFWLSTHVTTVTIGYSAGMLAGAVAHLYILGKALGIRRDDKDAYKSLTRMTYGILCFGLLFSTVGTVLGGIWANDSWGRFWGWDPKENGALMIVLCELAILHLRMGGYIRDFGVNMAAVFNAIVVGFSWFGVNLLGIGLHSYGFTSGVAKALFIFYVIEAVVLAIGSFVWLMEKGIVRIAKDPKQPKSPISKPEPRTN